MPQKKTQCERILHWLRTGHKLTALQALRKFGCFRLSARIKDLRKQDWGIVTKMVKKNGKTFAEYSL